MRTFNNSLLTTQLVFDKQNKDYIYESENEIMEMMKIGKISGLNQVVQKLQLMNRLEEVEDLVNQRDIHH